MEKHIILLIVFFNLFCYANIENEIPDRTKFIFTSKIGSVSYNLEGLDKSEKKQYIESIKSILVKSNMFDNVIFIPEQSKKFEKHHLDIFIYNGSSYKSGFFTGTPQDFLFMILTFSIFPGAQKKIHIYTIDYYIDGKLKSTVEYTQSENKFFGVIPLFLYFIYGGPTDKSSYISKNILNNALYHIEKMNH